MKLVPLPKINSILIFGILVFVVLYYARQVLIPVTFSVLLAMLMTPVANKLEEFKINRIFSSILCILIVLLVAALIIALIAAQVNNLSQDLPKIQQKAESFLQSAQQFFQEKFNVSSERQISFLKEQARSMTQSAGSFFKGFLTGLTSALAGIALVLVFTFLFLLQREKYENFILKLHKGSHPEKAKYLIHRISKVSQLYLAGRLLSIVILTVLYTIGLLIIGIKNAFLLSAIAALLTIIPYIGPFIGGFFPFAMALVTENSIGPALWVATVIIVVQAFDNYFIEPYVVGGEVSLSAFSTILIIVVGGYIWGIAGMILFIPMLGVVKIICDHIEPLKPYGYLIGDQQEQGPFMKIWGLMKKKFRK